MGSVVAFADGSLKHGFEWECDHRVFSGTPSPFIARVLSERIQFIRGPLGEERRRILNAVVQYARSLFAEAGFEVLGAHHLCSIPIRPQFAREVRERLGVRGFLTSVFEPPAVPRGSALLRFGLRADLTSDEIDSFVRACREVRDELSSAFVPSANRKDSI
jgi:7-keto-8-aminopelargonate synthetase-like enzyme